MSNFTSGFLKDIKLHPSWKPFFIEPETNEVLTQIETTLQGQIYTPAQHLVLRFAETDLKQIQTLISGRDPYPQGVATGRSFEVSNVTSWDAPEVNSSLRNIVKALHKAYMGLEVGASIERVRADIGSKIFPILPPNEAFNDWEAKGALFLNTAFTCELGGIEKAGSHVDLWKPFFNLLIAYIVKENPNIKYFLWGRARAISKTLIKLGVSSNHIYVSKHPCTNGDVGGYGTSTNFLNCPCFKNTMEEMKWIEKKE